MVHRKRQHPAAVHAARDADDAVVGLATPRLAHIAEKPFQPLLAGDRVGFQELAPGDEIFHAIVADPVLVEADVRRARVHHAARANLPIPR